MSEHEMLKQRAKAPGVRPISSTDATLQRNFNVALRDQLNALLSSVPDGETASTVNQKVSSVVKQMLEEDLTHEQWVEAFSEMNIALLSSYKKAPLTEEDKSTSFINATGHVVSVKDCINTVNDIYRVKAFIRGFDQALAAQPENKVLHVVYPACGPFAPLLLPLLSYYKNQVGMLQRFKVSLIDIQPGAIKVLQQAIEDLELTECEITTHCMDVMDYKPDEGIDLVVMEAMQHGFTREGHLAFLLHLRPFMNEDCRLLPEKISVRACLSNTEREYNEQWNEQERVHSDLVNEAIQQQRIDLGEILEVSKATLDKMQVLPLGDSIEMVECNQIVIPKGIPDISEKTLLITAVATVFGEESIDEYDSGISLPLPDMSICIDFKPQVPEPDDLLVKSGDKLKFYYKMGSTPGLLPTVA